MTARTALTVLAVAALVGSASWLVLRSTEDSPSTTVVDGRTVFVIQDGPPCSDEDGCAGSVVIDGREYAFEAPLRDDVRPGVLDAVGVGRDPRAREARRLDGPGPEALAVLAEDRWHVAVAG